MKGNLSPDAIQYAKEKMDFRNAPLGSSKRFLALYNN